MFNFQSSVFSLVSYWKGKGRRDKMRCILYSQSIQVAIRSISSRSTCIEQRISFGCYLDNDLFEELGFIFGSSVEFRQCLQAIGH